MRQLSRKRHRDLRQHCQSDIAGRAIPPALAHECNDRRLMELHGYRPPVAQIMRWPPQPQRPAAGITRGGKYARGRAMRGREGSAKNGAAHKTQKKCARPRRTNNLERARHSRAVNNVRKFIADASAGRERTLPAPPVVRTLPASPVVRTPPAPPAVRTLPGHHVACVT